MWKSRGFVTFEADLTQFVPKSDIPGLNSLIDKVDEMFMFLSTRDGSFDSKVGQIGPQIGQIRDFFRSDFSTFGSMSQMY